MCVPFTTFERSYHFQAIHGHIFKFWRVKSQSLGGERTWVKWNTFFTRWKFPPKFPEIFCKWKTPLALTHLNISEASFFARFLWLDAATRPYYINYSSYTVNAFRVQVENGWKMFSFCIFRSVWHIMISVVHAGGYASYSSQASEGYKLKAECLFLICLELLFSLCCNFWHIFRSSDKVTWSLEDLCLEQKRNWGLSERERQRQNRIPVIAHT